MRSQIWRKDVGEGIGEAVRRVSREVWPKVCGEGLLGVEPVWQHVWREVGPSCFGDRLGEVGEGMTSQSWREDLARLLSRRFGRWVGVIGERLWRECSPRRFVGVGVDVGGTLARRERSESLGGLETLDV